MHLICCLEHHGQFNLELARLSQWPSKGASKSKLMSTPVSSVSQLWLSEKDALILSLRETEVVNYFIRTLFNKVVKHMLCLKLSLAKCPNYDAT